jgi:hypothetical protein
VLQLTTLVLKTTKTLHCPGGPRPFCALNGGRILKAGNENIIKKTRTTAFRDADFARKRMGQALSHLATSHHKLRERVLDAYLNYVSEIPPTPKFLPDHDTLNDITTIRDTIHKVRQKIEQNPGPYELHLREGLKSSLEIAKSTLDYRIATKLANLISELHFKLQDGLINEYQDELLQSAKPLSLSDISKRLKAARLKAARH